MSKRTKFSKEVRERAVWMLVDHGEYGSRLGGLLLFAAVLLTGRGLRDI